MAFWNRKKGKTDRRQHVTSPSEPYRMVSDQTVYPLVPTIVNNTYVDNTERGVDERNEAEVTDVAREVATEFSESGGGDWYPASDGSTGDGGGNDSYSDSSDSSYDGGSSYDSGSSDTFDSGV